MYWPSLRNCRVVSKQNGAADGDRTHDIQLGKLTLYQLSYGRKWPSEELPLSNQSTVFDDEYPSRAVI
jgi:hypothetical protein